jgi:hypothetical protein
MSFFLFFGGTRLRTRPFADTHFHCPRCGVPRVAKRCRAGNWFHLYWIPLFRLEDLGELTVCGTCRGAFDAKGHPRGSVRS